MLPSSSTVRNDDGMIVKYILRSCDIHQTCTQPEISQPSTAVNKHFQWLKSRNCKSKSNRSRLPDPCLPEPPQSMINFHHEHDAHNTQGSLRSIVISSTSQFRGGFPTPVENIPPSLSDLYVGCRGGGTSMLSLGRLRACRREF